MAQDPTAVTPAEDILKKYRAPSPAVSAPKPETPQPLSPPPEKTAAAPVAAKTPAIAQPKSFDDIVSKYAPKPVSVEDQIRATAKQYGVDPDLAVRLAHQESGFNQKAISRSGARGVMQLMGSTASRYGVNPDDQEQNISGGVQYLRDLINRYDTTDKALAAYNWGESRVDQAIEKYGDNWLSHAPEETRKYVAALSSSQYWAQREPSVYMPQIFGRRGMEPRIPAPLIEPTPEKKSILSRLFTPAAEFGGKVVGWGLGGFQWGTTSQEARDRALDWWEENVPLRHFNARLLAGFQIMGGDPHGAKKTLEEGYRDPYKEFQEFTAKNPDWAKDPELKKQGGELMKATLPTQVEKFEHRAMATMFAQGSDPINVAFMFTPGGAILKGLGMGAKAVWFTRAAVDLGFAGMTATGAYKEFTGPGGTIDQFEHKEYGEGFASLLNVFISAGFATMGTMGAIHQTRSGFGLWRMDTLAKETYGRPWTELQSEQRNEIASNVVQATKKYEKVIREMAAAEENRDLKAYVVAAEKLQVPREARAGFREHIKRARKEAGWTGMGADIAPEERVSDRIERLKEALAKEAEKEPGRPVEEILEEKEEEIRKFVFDNSPLKNNQTWAVWQSMHPEEMQPTNEAGRELLRLVIDSEKRLHQAIYEEAARIHHEDPEEFERRRGELEREEQKHRERIAKINENLKAASPRVLEPGKPAPPKRPYEEPPAMLQEVPVKKEPPILEAGHYEDPMLVHDAVQPHIGEQRYRLENLIDHVNDFLETRKRPTSDAEIREELERLGKESEKEEFFRTADMAEAEEARLARERGWAFKGRRKAEDLTMTPTPDAARNAHYFNMWRQYTTLGELKKVILDEVVHLTENMPAASLEEAEAAQKAIDEAKKVVGGIEGTLRDINNEMPEEQKVDPDRDFQPATIPDEFLGKRVTLRTSRGYSVEAQYAVIESGAAKTSHDTDMNPTPDSPPRAQNRQRDSAFSARMRDDMAAHFDNEQVGESNNANHGAPVSGDDLVIEAGNLRSIVIKLLYKLGLAEPYKKWLVANAEKWGVSAESIGKLDKPMLIRIRRSSLGEMGKDRSDFVRDANTPFEGGMSAAEEAQSDAAAITSGMMALLKPGEDGDLFTAGNQPFIQEFFDKVIAPARRGSYMMSDGGINVAGVRRIQNAIFAKAYPNAGMEKLLDDPDNNLRNVARAMFSAAPKFAQLTDLIQAGKLQDLNLSPEINEAITKLSALRDAGQFVKDYLKTGEMFGSSISPAARSILEVFDMYARRPMKVAEVFEDYANDAMRLGQSARLGETGEVSKEGILGDVIQRVAGGGLFPGGEGTVPVAVPAPQEGGKPVAALTPTGAAPSVPPEGVAKVGATPEIDSLKAAYDTGLMPGEDAEGKITPTSSEWEGWLRFRDPETGAMVSIKKSDFSMEKLKEKVAEAREQAKAFEKGSTETSKKKLAGIQKRHEKWRKQYEESNRKLVEPLSPTPEAATTKAPEKAPDTATVERLVADHRKTLVEKNGRKKLQKALKSDREGVVEMEELAKKLADPNVSLEEFYTTEELEEAHKEGFDTPEKLLSQARKVNADELMAYRANIAALERVLGEAKGAGEKVVKAEPTLEGKVVEPPVSEPKTGGAEPPPNLEVPGEYPDLTNRPLTREEYDGVWGMRKLHPDVQDYFPSYEQLRDEREKAVGRSGNEETLSDTARRVMYANAEKAGTKPPEAEPKKGYGEQNKIVTKDRYEELKKRAQEKIRRMAEGREPQAGIDPTILKDVVEMVAYHIESGVREFVDVANRMMQEMGEWVKPYLRPAWESLHGKPDENTMAVAQKLQESAEKTGQMGLFGEVSNAEPVRGKNDVATQPEKPGGVKPRPGGTTGPEGTGGVGGAGGSVRGGRETAADRRRAERNRELRDVPNANLAPAVERVTPPAWEEKEWKQTLKDAGLPLTARIPTRRLYRNISDRLIFGLSDETGKTGQEAIADSILSELVDGNGGFVLAAGTGTGKTWLGNAVLKQLLEMQPESMKRVLIVTKGWDLIDNGENGLRDIAKRFGIEVQDYPKSGIPQKDGIYVTTYATARGREGIDEFPWDFVLADESGEARNWDKSRQGAILKKIGDKAKKVLYMSATPFHNAVEVGYATKLGLWKGSDFEKWVEQFGVHRNPSTGEWLGHSNPRRVEKMRQQLMERGQMIDWPRNMDGYHAHFGVVPVAPGDQQTLAGAVRAWRMVADYYRQKRSSKMVMAANGNAVTFAKHLTESFRLQQAAEIIKKATDQGYQGIIFSERRSPVEKLYEFVQQADNAYGGQIAKLMPSIEGFSNRLRDFFGEDLAIYTGEKGIKERREELDAFNSGKKKVLFSTYGAGGIGVSMHDTVGNRPRVVVYLGPPWSGVAFDQAVGRPWRFGTMSNVHSIFLFSNTRPEVNLVASRIYPRMASLRAIVNGVLEGDPIVKGLQHIDRALQYEHGQKQKNAADEFIGSVDTKGFQSYKDIKLDDPANHFYRGMKVKKRVLPMDKPPEEPTGGGGTTLYSNPIFDPEVWKKYIIKDISEMFAKRANASMPEADRASGVANRIAEEVFGSKEFRKVAMENIGTADAASKFSKNVGTLVADAVSGTEGDSTPVVLDVLDNARKWLETMPGTRDGMKAARTAERAGATMVDQLLYSGRGIIRKLARQAGSPELGNELVDDIMEYHTQQGLIAGPWEGRFADLRKKYNLKPEDFEHVWNIIEGEEEAKNPRFEEAAAEIRRINRDIQQTMIQNGVTVTAFNRLTGKPNQFAFPSRPRPDYMPRIYDEEVFRFGSKKREQIINRIMERQGISRVEAELELAKRDNPETPLAGNIERARENDIPGYEKTLHAYMKYLDGAAEVVARTKVFGQAREKLRGKIGMIDSQQARQDIDEIFDQLLSRNRFQKGPSDIVRLASDWTAILKMPFSSIKMLTHMPKAAVMTNTRSFVEALGKVIQDYPQAYRAALEAGSVLHQARVDMMREFGVSQRIGDKVLRLYQVPEADTLSRVLSDQTARVFLNRYALPELITNPKSDYRRILREHFGLSDGAMNKAIEEKRWSKEDLNRGAARVAAKAQGTWDPTELPPAWRTIPASKAGQTLAALFRTSVMLKSYIYKNGVFFRDMLINEARRGNFRPWIPFVLIFPALGEAIEDLSEAVRGNPARFKELTESKTYEPWNLVQRIAGDLAFNTAANLATTAFEGFTRFKESPWAAMTRTVEGPALGDLHVFMADLMQSFKDIFEGNPEKLGTLWRSFGRRISPLVRTGEKVVKSVGNEFEEPELELTPRPE